MPSSPTPPAVNLNPLTLVSPHIAGDTLSVNIATLPVQVQVPPTGVALTTVKMVMVTITELDGSPAPIFDNEGNAYQGAVVDSNGTAIPGSFLLAAGATDAGMLAFTGTLLLPSDVGTYRLTFLGCNTTTLADATRVTPSLSYLLIPAANLEVPSILPPSSISVLQTAANTIVQWETPATPGFLGVRVMTSTDSTGVNTPFTQYGYLINAVALSAMETILTSESSTLQGSAATGGVQTTTSTSQLSSVDYSQALFPNTISTDADGNFYVMLTTVVQDPATNIVYESYAAGPFPCSFVNLQVVGPADFSQGFAATDFASFLIANLTQMYPGLDLSPRSELRDLLVDPVAQELALAGDREWFIRASQSVSALAKIDDATSSGVSDDPATSAYKQRIAQAFRLTNDQTQTMINTQFNVLGEAAGLPRNAPRGSLVDVLFYVKKPPTSACTVTKGATIATTPDVNTPHLTFTTLAQAILDPASLDSYYIPSLGWWGVVVPCSCTSTGANTNVGAGTLNNIVAGASGFSLCTNLSKASYGADLEGNPSYASRIRTRQIVGVDTGSRNGLQILAQQAIGVIDVEIVAAGDLEMLRDWLPAPTSPVATPGRHIFGCVDIYARGDGGGFSQQLQDLTYTHQTQEEPLTLVSVSPLVFRRGTTTPIAAITSLTAVTPGSTVGLTFNATDAQFDAATSLIYLDPTAMGTNATGNSLTNTALAQIIQTTGNYATTATTRYWSALSLTPAAQPILAVNAVTGQSTLTGNLPADDIRLIKTQDIMLVGESSQATDTIMVNNANGAGAVPELLSLTFMALGGTTLGLGEGVILPILSTGKPDNAAIVVSSTSGSLYNRIIAQDGTASYDYTEPDYTIIPQGPYGNYAIQWKPGSTIPLSTPFNVALRRYPLRENLQLQTDTLVLSGGSPVPLSQNGVVLDTVTPVSHGLTALSADPTLIAAATPPATRYIKVVGAVHGVQVVMQEGTDFLLSTDPDTQQTTIAQIVQGGIVTGNILDGTSLSVTYYYAENFTFAYQYPEFIGQITTALKNTKHADADVLVKAMMQNTVDLTITVTLEPKATSSVVDGAIRTAIGSVFDNASEILTQSEFIYRLQQVPGVKSVSVPFTRMARTNGSYDLDCVIPTTQPWVQLQGLPTMGLGFASTPQQGWQPSTWITGSLANNVFTPDSPLNFSTMPGGGPSDSYVGMLYEGQSFIRRSSIADILSDGSGTPSFYIIGVGDVDWAGRPVPSSLYGCVILHFPFKNVVQTNPQVFPYRVTYQVFGEIGPMDIEIGPMEYLAPGNITIDYISSTN